MKTDELKKGTRVRLRNGWYATLEDNRRGTTRMATVEGVVVEMGSIYSHDIMAYKLPGDNCFIEDIEYTQAQQKCRAANKALFGE